MLSYTNTIETKEHAVANAKWHKEHDMLLRGTYAKGEGDDFRGCSVGCLYKSYEGKIEASSLHALSETVHGIPEWLTRLRDTMFESISKEKIGDFHVEFSEAIPIGISPEIFEKKVKAPFLVIVLKSVLKNFDNDKFPDVTKTVHNSIKLWERNDLGSDDWKRAAAQAAWTAWTAWTAARAAQAAWTAWTAWTAARAAQAAAWTAAEAAAEAAAWAAAEAARATRAEKMDYFADELLKLLHTTIRE